MPRKRIIIGALILISAIMFGFLNRFFKSSDKATKNNPSNLVLGMALLNDVPQIDFKKIVDELKSNYNQEITGQDLDHEKGVGIILLKNSQITIMRVDMPIPGDELEFPAQIAYLWPEAKEVIPRHKAHIIISVSSADESKLNMFKTFTKAAAATLTNTQAFGIYLGSQTLVLPTAFYVDGATSMTDDDLPLMNWVYFGLRHDDGKSNGYTYGLKEFGFDELEILNSGHTLEDVQGMLFNIAHYVIQNNVTLKDGETIGLTAEQKIRIARSKGVLLEGTTLKLEY